MKKTLVAVATAIALLFGTAACGDMSASGEPDYMGVCVDPNTETRLDDDACDDDESEFLTYAVLWYLASNSGHAYPGVGHKVNKSHYVTSLPKGKKAKMGLSSKGGSSVKSYTNKKYGNGGSSGSKKNGGSNWGGSKPGGGVKRK